MNKRQYITPTVQFGTIVEHLLDASEITAISTNLDTADNIDLSDEPAEEGFWGR